MDVRRRAPLQSVSAHRQLPLADVHRYRFVASLLDGERVLELGCDVGHGSRILAETCTTVTAVDRDGGVIATALEANADSRVSYEAGDALLLLRSGRARFGAVVALDPRTLNDEPSLIRELARLARSGTKLVLVADGGCADAGLGSRARVLGSLERCSDVVVLEQYAGEASLIGETTSEGLSGAVILADRAEPEYAEASLVCVNLGAVAAAGPTGLAQLLAAPAARRVLIGLETANRELRRANARLTRERLGRHGAPGATLLSKVQARVDAADEARGRAEAELIGLQELGQSREARIEQLHTHMLAFEREIETMRSTRVWRAGERFWALKQRLRRQAGS